jgi:hypothetical protein
MRKEVFLAIVAGSTLGLLIAFGVWKINSSHTETLPSPFATQTPVSSPSTQNSNNHEFKVIIIKPDNLSIFTETPAIVTGAIKPNSYVVISGEETDEILNASDSGTFTSNIDLTGGINQINVTGYDANGNEADTNLLVIYSSQFILPKIGTATSYIGTVTDITNSVIQIKTATGDIQQITGTENASYIDTRNKNSKQIKSSDIAIGDYIVAMGSKGTNNILSSSRILVTDSLTKSTRKSFLGTVTDDSGINKFIAKNSKTGETITVTPASGIQILGAETSFGRIKNDEKVIVTGNFKDGSIAARTIEVLK